MHQGLQTLQGLEETGGAMGTLQDSSSWAHALPVPLRNPGSLLLLLPSSEPR